MVPLSSLLGYYLHRMNRIVVVHFLNCFVFLSQCQEFQLNSGEERITRGKNEYEKLTNQAKSHFTTCWKDALKSLDNSCRKMSDSDQSHLALQFANCHLAKSGLKTYLCTKDNFKECTHQMGNDVIAFLAYTEFFTHVSDICFYLQSDVWREETERTISLLTEKSTESLDILAKSSEQQIRVLQAQQQSLKNQEDMLLNEQILKEAIKTSADSAKNVYQEVREHAEQQKTLFSDTFENIFQSVERLASLQNMLIGEFIGLQSIAFYFVATIVSYLFTSTPRTASARLILFIALTVLITTERIFISWRISNTDPKLSSQDIHQRIWFLRKIFLLIATVILGIVVIRYKDFNKINYNMLQDIQIQIVELRKLQEAQQSMTSKVKSEGSGAVDNDTLVDTTKQLEEATKQLELSMLAFGTSTPHKQHENNLFNTDTFLHKAKAKNMKMTEYSDLNDDYDNDRKENGKKQQHQGSENIKNNISQTVNESRYNLRSRSNNSITNTLIDQSQMNTTKIKKVPTRKVGKGKNVSKSRKPTAFFSSDED